MTEHEGSQSEAEGSRSEAEGSRGWSEAEGSRSEAEGSRGRSEAEGDRGRSKAKGSSPRPRGVEDGPRPRGSVRGQGKPSKAEGSRGRSEVEGSRGHAWLHAGGGGLKHLCWSGMMTETAVRRPRAGASGAEADDRKGSNPEVGTDSNSAGGLGTKEAKVGGCRAQGAKGRDRGCHRARRKLGAGTRTRRSADGASRLGSRGGVGVARELAGWSWCGSLGTAERERGKEGLCHGRGRSWDSRRAPKAGSRGRRDGVEGLLKSWSQQPRSRWNRSPGQLKASGSVPGSDTMLGTPRGRGKEAEGRGQREEAEGQGRREEIV